MRQVVLGIYYTHFSLLAHSNYEAFYTSARQDEHENRMDKKLHKTRHDKSYSIDREITTRISKASRSFNHLCKMS